jgi:hypothetical protein
LEKNLSCVYLSNIQKIDTIFVSEIVNLWNMKQIAARALDLKAFGLKTYSMQSLESELSAKSNVRTEN